MQKVMGFARRPRVRATAAAVLAVAVVGGVLAAGLAVGKQQGRQAGREEVVVALPVFPDGPVLRASDGVCGSRFELHLGAQVYGVFLDSRADTRVQLLDPLPNMGCVPAEGEDPTGADSARVMSGWDTQTSKCVDYAVIDGRRWLLDDPVGGYLQHGTDRVVAGDERCGGAEQLPAEPLGEGVCKRPDGWNYAWDRARGRCLPVP
ncbi:hypothetical protein [Mycolicibacterium fallax]|uniref:Uncharacterized protein n=2 Tax=Mycolicibacterium fallax TaxID=1793 RepID=A0A1X1R048_MYCFA|nr:hypothetical protein [Mycolicibacterium fallax]ORU97252.1 hypothetical protein AWC04_18385 [Mycolicibacterium fallax]BBY97856.1 hypothetical protein MFAL_13230 [Mycolicibacterium fallax]